jgi:hypothetical protein
MGHRSAHPNGLWSVPDRTRACQTRGNHDHLPVGSKQIEMEVVGHVRADPGKRRRTFAGDHVLDSASESLYLVSRF